MAKQKRREQNHLRQEPARRRSYASGSSAPNEIYKPGFPMNLLGSVKFFSIVGVVVIISFVLVAFLTGQNTTDLSNTNPDAPTATPTVEGGATADPSASPTADPKVFSAAEPSIDAATKKYTATVKTNKGEFEIELFADQAPNTVNSFVFLAKKGYFDGITFHRTQPNFVIQGGDPKGTGVGGPGYSTSDEPNQISNTRGTVAMAKVGGASSFGSQFFVNLKDNTTLDYNNSQGDKFYPFGKVTRGMEVVDEISKVPTGANFRPTQPVTIESVTINESNK